MKSPRIQSLFLVLPMLFLIACTQSVPVTPIPPPTQQPTTQEKFPITILSPDFSKPVSSPLTIRGKVSGLYFFEGTFPVVLQDKSGKVLAEAGAHSDGDVMTEAEVPFTIELNFKVPAPMDGTLILQKDNPSGLPENDFSRTFAVHLQ